MSQDDGLLTISHAELAEMLEEVSRAGGCLRFQAHGRSMWPFVRSGDTLIVEPLGGHPVQVGDVLLYRTPGGGVAAHRVTGFAGAALHIRGDRLLAPLEIVEPPDVLGRVAAIERDGEPRSIVWRRTFAVAWIAVRPPIRACRTALARARAAACGPRHSDRSDSHP